MWRGAMSVGRYRSHGKVSAVGAEVNRLSWFCKGTTNGSDFVAIRITHIEGGIEIGVGLDFSRET
jgi:hypothetical protein